MNKKEMLQNLYGSYGLIRRAYFDKSDILKGNWNKTEIKMEKDLNIEEKKLLTYISKEYKGDDMYEMADMAIRWIGANERLK